MLACWRGGFGHRRAAGIWWLLRCVTCGLFRGQNMRTFEVEEHSVLELKSLFLHSLYDWMLAMRGLSFSSFIEFIDL